MKGNSPELDTETTNDEIAHSINLPKHMHDNLMILSQGTGMSESTLVRAVLGPALFVWRIQQALCGRINLGDAPQPKDFVTEQPSTPEELLQVMVMHAERIEEERYWAEIYAEEWD